MCYSYSVKTDHKKLEQRYNAKFEAGEEFAPIYHTSGFVFEKLPAILSNDPTSIKLINWGLIPAWSKDKAKAFDARKNTLNAKCETIYEKPSFRGSAKNRRCLILATGFFEWMDKNKMKFPHHISVKDEEIFSFGGLWDSVSFVNEEGHKEVIQTFSVITTDANPLMAKIHNLKQRMPFILPRELESKWLNETLSKQEVDEILLPFPEERMQAHTISKLITSRTTNPNVPEVLAPYEYPELNMMF